MTLIDRDILIADKDNYVSSIWGDAITISDIENAATVPAIPIKTIRKYLIDCIEEWNNLGDRKYELANIQVYTHIRKCLDDLENYQDTMINSKGHWINQDNTYTRFQCSSCHASNYSIRSNYCPNCGIEME